MRSNYLVFCSLLTFFTVSCVSDSSTPSGNLEDQLSSSITAEEVVYGTHKGKKLIGYVAKPKAAGNAPVVLVVHEWWGQTDYPRKRAQMLAELGYIALAVDMYGDRSIADHPKDAKAFMMKTLKNIDETEAKFMTAMDFAKKIEGADGKKIAAIGYCYGGGIVLHMARIGLDLAGVASFHGSLTAQKAASKKSLKAKIAVFNGEADPMVKADDVSKFKTEMKQAGAALTFVNYPGALHGFTNPEASQKGATFKLPLGYQETADKDSWSKLENFLKESFR